LSLSNDEIVEELSRLDKDAKAIKKDLLSTCWYMRGSISYNDAMMLSSSDREIINDIIKTNLETTEKSGLPFF
jgi:hypothetical protein